MRLKEGEFVVNIDKLKGKMKEKNVTQAELADSIGVARSTINRKMSNGGDDFSIEEVQMILVVLDISNDEAIEIFLPLKSQK